MELDSATLLYAYSHGIFPMADMPGIVNWYRPERRGILPFGRLHISHSLARLLRTHPYQLRVNGDFEAVMRACAAPAPGREETWIDEELIRAYVDLHNVGSAHSVEVVSAEGTIVGGLYGVTVGGLFAGESMFSRVPSASKIALVFLVRRLQERGFRLLDVQFLTPHLQKMGAIVVSSARYDQLLQQALQVSARFVD